MTQRAPRRTASPTKRWPSSLSPLSATKTDPLLTLLESVTTSPNLFLLPSRTRLPPVAIRISSLLHAIPRSVKSFRSDPTLAEQLRDHRNGFFSPPASGNPRALCRQSKRHRQAETGAAPSESLPAGRLRGNIRC